MERLGEKILKEVDDNHLNPSTLSNNGPSISHIFFADDVLLFAKAWVCQARVIKKSVG